MKLFQSNLCIWSFTAFLINSLNGVDSLEICLVYEKLWSTYIAVQRWSVL